MKPWTETLTLAALAVLFTLPLAGCAEDGPGVAAVPEPAPGDPAIYAPAGWPLQIGDKVSTRRFRELNAKFPSFGLTSTAINVVNGRTYAARFGSGEGFLPDEDFSDPQLAFLRDLDFGSHHVYEGHFPRRVPETFREDEHLLPEHLRGRIDYYTPHPKPRRQPFDQRVIDLRKKR